MIEQPNNAIVITDIEVLALKKLVLVNHALGQVMTDHLAAREQRALTEVLSAITVRADHANHMAKLAPPPALQPKESAK